MIINELLNSKLNELKSMNRDRSRVTDILM